MQNWHQYSGSHSSKAMTTKAIGCLCFGNSYATMQKNPEMIWFDEMTAHTVPLQIHHHAEECETDADWKTADDSSDRFSCCTHNKSALRARDEHFWKGRAASPANCRNEQVLSFRLACGLSQLFTFFFIEVAIRMCELQKLLLYLQMFRGPKLCTIHKYFLNHITCLSCPQKSEQSIIYSVCFSGNVSIHTQCYKSAPCDVIEGTYTSSRLLKTPAVRKLPCLSLLHSIWKVQQSPSFSMELNQSFLRETVNRRLKWFKEFARNSLRTIEV